MYQARVVGAMSYLGDRMTKPYRWSFETLTPDPPQVTKTDPRAGEELVPPDTAITVFFDRAILVGSTGDSTNEFLALEGPNGPVKGYVEWLKGDEDQEAATSTGLADLLGQNSYDSAGRYQGYRGLRFRPLAGLQPGATYEATVRGVENLYGVPMAGPYTWNFTVDPQGQILTIPAPEVRKYYYHNGQRVAMRQIGLDGSDVLYFIVGDHLSTTSLVLDAEGDKVAESRHLPYGGERWRWPEDSTFPTDYRFAGQRFEQPLGIYTMGARWYDPYINRWLSADTIVPEPGNPQSFNRYSYVNNRPLVAIDPWGHDLVIVGGAGGNVDPWAMENLWMQWILAYKGWTAESAEWKELYADWKAAVAEGGLTAGNTVLHQQGIHLFTWGANTIEGAIENAGSWGKWDEGMLDTLSNQISGHSDVTLAGWSRGGNLVMMYLEKLAAGAELTKVKHAILIAPADTFWSELRPGIPGVGEFESPSGVNVANVCAEDDFICDPSVRGAIDFNEGLSGHGPHGHVAKQVFDALSVANDRMAWGDPVPRNLISPYGGW